GQFKYALPAHIPAERFIRVLMTAVQNNPKLLACNKQSFFNAAMRCAQDGLLPDGREAAIVPFGDNEDGQKKSDQASYLPMVAGIRKKIRNSGEISDLSAHVVYEGDEFDYQLGDEPFIHHKRGPNAKRTNNIVAAYSIAKFKDGTLSRDVMMIGEIEDIRRRSSRATKGPWSVKEFYPEMCVKTVVRHHAKTLPTSTDLDRVFHRDDEIYGLHDRAADEGKVRAERVTRTAQVALDTFANGGDDDEVTEAETVKTGEAEAKEAQAAKAHATAKE